MYGTYNSDSLEYQQPVLIIVTVLIIIQSLEMTYVRYLNII